MEYGLLGRTGLKVSPLCLGTGLWIGRNSESECLAMIDLALEAGINFIDTANVYSAGESEKVIGKGLKGRRDSIVLATKVRSKVSGDHPNDGGLSRKHIIEQVEISLKSLQTDYIDLYQMHRTDDQTPIDVTLRAFDDLVSQGKVRYIGLSNFTGAQLVESLWASEKHGFSAPVTEQSNFSLVRRGAESDVLPWCKEYEVAFMGYSPLARGTLSGRYASGALPPEGSRVQRIGMHNQGWWQDALKVVDRLRTHVVAKGCSLSAFAVAWSMAQTGVTPIIGPRTIEQLEDNLGALEVDITDEDLALVDSLVAPGTHV